ncbi:beta-L-arabinofuranosidase domain-containing protein [Rathayibacter sp. VKM Ac-2857]|uniref:beta-L-arabinofuranosidase domain-containing protein n=1 Tax=Rathayibacter sp. VKM Ac-2857 TaxID=2739020 RepID=UPI001566BEA5|nr:beta-L-arabinofuranosidase domain-containing protein [Rathayibacter sp. VKM Ac-2857]NQX17652.1 glycoside hydrolase family 127 protein [Rathayibacter sp. VKM Ac-2857]
MPRTAPAVRPVRRFPLRSVRLLPSAFADAQATGQRYLLALDPDRLLAPFLREAGLPAAEGYGNWEADGLDGHVGGHALSASALMLAATGEEAARERMEILLDGFERAQDAVGTGYLGGVPGGRALGEELARGEVDADLFTLNGRWVPLYNLHKTLSGLLDAAAYGGSERALAMAVRFADWWLGVSAGLDDEAFEAMLHAEFGGMNEAFADLAEQVAGADPGDPERAAAYRAEAARFSHRALLDPLLQHRDALDGLHANTQIPKAVGYARLGGELLPAARFFWEQVTRERTVAIGGNSVREHFHRSSDFTPMILDREGPETCNTANMIELSSVLFEASGDERYLDYLERAQYNHVLSSQHPDGGFVYFTPLRPAHYRVYSAPHEGMWCCVGTGLENHARYGELIYALVGDDARAGDDAHDGDDLLIALYLPSTLDSPEHGLRARIDTAFPHADDATITVHLERPGAVRLRRPAWAESMTVTVDGAPLDAAAVDGVVRTAVLTPGRHEIRVGFSLAFRAEPLPDGSAWSAFSYGPVVLAARTDAADLDGLIADGRRMAHVAAGPLRDLAATPIVTGGVGAVALLDRATLTAELATDAGPVRLEPFAGLHDSRYTLYWPTGSDAVARRAELAALDREAAGGAAVIDSVTAGEQQPESDHAFVGHRSRAGGADGRHWRGAEGPDGWFGYTLVDAEQRAAVLRVLLRDGGGEHELRIDGRPLGEPLAVRARDGEVEADYAITPSTGEDGLVEFSLHAVGARPTGELLAVSLVAGAGE